MDNAMKNAMKIKCRKCKKQKNIIEFNASRVQNRSDYICKICLREIKKKYWPAYYKKKKEAIIENQRRRLMNYRKEAIKLLGGKCIVCDETDIRVLQINHKNSDAFLLKENGHVFWINIVKGYRKLDDLDIRCANHNIIYEYEHGHRIKLNKYLGAL